MGFNLIELGNDKWKIEGSQIKFEGTFLQVATFAVKVLKFNVEELEFAVSDMIEKDNDIAHFGALNRTFIFSKSSKEKVTS